MKNKNEIQNKFEALSHIHSVCGEDVGMFAYIEALLKDTCDKIYRDSIGNIIAEKSCGDENAKTVALVAVCDDTGFAVTSVSGNKATLHPVGLKGASLSRLSGRYAHSVSGAFGVLVAEGDALVFETEDEITEGDFVYAEDMPLFLGDNTVYLCGIASKVFATCLTDIARREGDFPCNLKLVFLSCHHLGARGAVSAAYKICADEVIAFDFVGNGSAKCGQGPVLSFGDAGGFCSRDMVKRLEEVAETVGIKVNMCSEVNKERPSVILPFISEGTKTAIIGVYGEKAQDGIYKCAVSDILGCEAIACAYLIF